MGMVKHPGITRQLSKLALPMLCMCFLLVGLLPFAQAVTATAPLTLLTVTQGTQANGTISDLVAGDADILTINEANGGTNGIQTKFTFVDVPTSPSRIDLSIYEMYVGLEAHFVGIYLYNYDTASYVHFTSIPNEVSYQWHNISLINGDLSVYVSGGVVLVELLHIQTGIQSHRLYLDTVQLSASTTDATPTPAPTATPTPTQTTLSFSPLLILFLVWVVFNALSFTVRDVYLFAVTGLISLILGVFLALEYVASVENWAFGVIGAAIFLYGFWLLIAALQYSLSGKAK